MNYNASDRLKLISIASKYVVFLMEYVMTVIWLLLSLT